MSFVDVQLQTDPAAMVDGAIDSLTAQFAGMGIVGWTPNDASLAIIMLSVIAQMAVDVAIVAAQVPAAIFRKFGTALVGIPYLQGATATVLTTWTAVDTVGYTLSSGTYVTLNNMGFYVQADTTIPPGSSTATNVLLVAVENGVKYNLLTGPAVLVDALDWVSSVTVIGQTSGGQDQETDDDYQNRLAAQLTLQAPRPITAHDHQVFILSFPPALGTDQQEVGRAVAIDGYDPTATGTFSATRTSGSPTLSVVTGGVSANVGAGTAISGTGIPALTTVLVNNGATITMSANASSSAAGMTVTATGLYNQQRAVTTFIAAADGTALNSDTLTATAAWLQTYREANFLEYTRGPTYTTIYVTTQIKCLPSADATGTTAAVKAALLSYLSPTGFGQAGTSGTTNSGWINDPFIRYNKLIALGGNIPGVDEVVTLTVGTSASPVGVVDVPVFGPASLVLSDATTILVTHA